MIDHDYKHRAYTPPTRTPTSLADFAAGLSLVFLIVSLTVLILML